MMRIDIGNVVITPILDGVIQLDPREAAPQVEIDTLALENPGLIDANGWMPTPVACFLVFEGEHVTLVDTGIGPWQRNGMPRGTLDAKLARAGIRPHDVNLVVLTHLHDDHVGWNTIEDDTGKAQRFFPHAEYVVHSTEWQYWTSPEQRAAEGCEYLAESVLPIAYEDKLRLVTDDGSLTRSLTIVSTPGHTPGHIAVGIYSKGERALLIGDVSHYVAQLNHPEWSPVWDTDPELSANTRARLFDSAEAEGALLLPTHYPFPAIGQVIRVRGRRIFGAFEGVVS
jgi:glyoxylase-like metal-dependent hydrolase (beta-lactamase superfamily II)